MFKDSPVFGGGYGNLTNIYTGGYSVALYNGAVGFSNSVMAILGTGGIYNFIIFAVPTLIVIFTHLKNEPEYFAFATCYLYLSITTIFFARYIQAIFVAYMICLLIMNKNQKEERYSQYYGSDERDEF